MKITYAEACGLSLDVLMKVAPEEEISIEPELFLDIPDDLYERWDKMYREAQDISYTLHNLYQEQHNV